ncbi:MAG TPA: tetratricopeptide repeat protein, partial [Puia sp.]
MSGKVFFMPLLFLVILSFKAYERDPPSFRAISRQFAKADSLFNLTNTTSITDSAALEEFRQVMEQSAAFGRSAGTDSIFFQSFYKAGVLYEVSGKFRLATLAYLQALVYAADERERLKMYVFAGAGYYYQNNFDSANYFLLKAEEDAGNQAGSEDLVRLYNTLGVLYYDNGNYLQSKNYFNQALSIIRKKNPADRVNALSVQLNMATCFYRLGLYDQALQIYQGATRQKLFLNQIYMNMGRAYAGLRRYPQALTAFRQVQVEKLPAVLNEMARVALESGHSDSAQRWLDLFRSEKEHLKVNMLDAGINMLYSGDLDLYRSDPESALKHLQEAVILFSGNFKDPLIRHNPTGFTGSFAYYTLFDALYKKATAWELQYKKTSRPEDLQSAFDTYQSTLALLTYIERSYEMDDAKILLKQKSAQVYKNALQVCFDLYQLYPDSHYLEDAFIISERNKASVMASNLREKNFHFSSDQEDELVSQERNIKFNIARLSIKSDQEPEAGTLEKINADKAAYESRLAAVQKQLEKDSRYYQLKYQDDYPSIRKLQTSLNANQAMISLSNTPEAVHVFVVTRSSFRHIKLDSGSAIRENVGEWIRILQNTENGKHAATRKLGQLLYTQLIKPLEGLAGDKEDWIVVPDGIFFLLPFESLPADASGTL